MSAVVGIIANPVAARDIRRVIANAGSLQISDRANVVLRILASLRACGVVDALVMPERGGIAGYVERGLKRSRDLGEDEYPRVHYVQMPVTGTVDDTHRATIAMCKAGVSAIVVLGGDGTHRAVARHCGTIPIAGVSTGTNNAFPDHREPTITALATGLAATGRVPGHIAFHRNKVIEVSVNDGEIREIALVDVAIVTERYVGARALWRPENFRELFVTFADPEAIGLSAVAGLLEPVARGESGGLMVRMAAPALCATVVTAPIAPGRLTRVGVTDWRRMPANVPFVPRLKAGSIALDGERELAFSERDRVVLTLQDEAFRTVNVSGAMQYAAQSGLLRRTTLVKAAE